MRAAQLLVLAVGAGAVLLASACSDAPSEATMRSWTEEQWTLPRCEATFSFVSRGEGDGWLGGSNTFLVDGDNSCWDKWRRSMEQQGGRCSVQTCDVVNDEGGLTVTQQSPSRLQVRRWSNS